MNAVSPRTRLRQEFQSELHGYHQMHGEKNGSGLEGTIYPPDLKANDDVALEARVDKLSDFLSKQPGINFRPTPVFGQGRIEDRAEVAAASSGWVKACGKVALQTATDLIVDPSIRAMVMAGFKEVDSEFFRAPSSSSGMFHPADEINDGGLALHTARVVQMGEYLGEFFQLSDREQDTLRAGLLLHDTVKGGVPWNGYANDHGELAGELIKGLKGPADVKKVAAQIASNHMALWRKTAQGEPNPAVPDNKMDMVASLADYLAARDNIYVDVPGLDKTIPPTSTPADRLPAFSYAGKNKNAPAGLPREVEVTTEKETLKLVIDGQSYTGKISSPTIEESYLTYSDFKPDKGRKNPLKGMQAKANFWLLTGAKGGKVILSHGDQEAAYFVKRS